MDREQARNIIISTFENSFDKEGFILFLKNLLKTFEEKTFVYQGNYIPDAFEQYISSLERIGKYTDNKNEIDLLIVQLKRETSLERARTMQRNFIAWYLKGSRGGKLKDAALVAFVSPDNNEDWRFSLVKLDYRFEEATSGRIKVKEEFTPAKRWSFLVGKNEKSHTAQSRLLPILEKDDFPTLEDLEKVFDVEVVTKEFFEKYRDLFIRTKLQLDEIVKNNPKVQQEFQNKNINTVDFAKKLLGQIVFLYFLQKKGWFGVEKEKRWGTGPKDFIRRLFNKEFGGYENFYNDILEPLFYEALRTDRSADDHYYSRFNCKIPFLNGGLFDPQNNFDWVDIDILLPNELFSNTNKTKEGDIGDGILDVFNRYNFTVNEEEPLEKEVALDPELLGKIYEKLNAIRPDNFDEYVKVLKPGKKGEETKFNKEYGVYYTPREIVHYMCQESLIEYLCSAGISTCAKKDVEEFVRYADLIPEHERTAFEKKEKIERGVQKETKYEHKIPESIIQNAELIDKLLADIKVCDPAVGSGAFPIGMMHEITKLRQLLSIYLAKPINTYDLKRNCIENSLYGVDIDPGSVEICKLRFWLSMIVDEENFYNIKPLPNLDYKVVCGDSLLGVEKDLFNIEAFSSLEGLKPLYFKETRPGEKQKYKSQIDGLIKKISKGYTQFDFEVYFSEVFHQKGGFDIVIANPPYGGKYLDEYISYFKEHYYCTGNKNLKGSLDTFVLFIEKGYSILRIDGNLIFIVPISVISSDSVQALHTLLEKTCKIIKVSSYAVRPKPVFESAVVNTSIISFIKTMSPVSMILCSKMYRKDKKFNLEYLLNNLQFIDVKKFKLRGRYPKISLFIEKNILEKLFLIKTKIGDIIVKRGKPIYYRAAGGRYFKVVTNYSTGSSAEKNIYFEERIANVVGAILSSNLFFWWYQIYSDNLNLKLYEIETFPIPIDNLADEVIKRVNKAYNYYLRDIEKNAKVKKSKNYAKVKEFKEYKISLSKKFIDEIDDIIGPIYGLSSQEIELIKNYEIEFRMREEEEEDE